MNCLRFLVIAPLLMLSVLTLQAQGAKPLENEVKAAYLLNFGRFARWPADSTVSNATTFLVCVLGRDPFGAALETTVAGERIDGKPVATQRITDLDALSTCRIVFIGESEQRRLSQILEQLMGRPVLTVSDLPDFADQGGMIQFVAASNRIRFAVNVDATERVGLLLSSELLRVALTIKRAKPGA
jgi:hypothetical protein